MYLAENVRDYYLAHMADLTDEKQFHLCSRLAAWNKNPAAIKHLNQLKQSYVPSPCTKQTLTELLAGLTTNPPDMPANAAKVRDVYFNKYPWLRGLELGLFRVRHLMEIYGIDARPSLFEIISRKQLLAYEKELLQDEDAMRMLSTYAINYTYLVERVILDRAGSEAIDIHKLLKIGSTYDTGDIIQLQLYMYYYTHCIIAESNFYARDIPISLLPVYAEMLQRLDTVVATHFDSLSLDTKLEFLVCAKLCNYPAKTETRIMDECQQSISPDGTFIIDTFNSFSNRDNKKSFDASEHRNVLFVMAASGRTA